MKNKFNIRKYKKKIFLALFVLLNAAVILYTALSEFAGGGSDTKFKDLSINGFYLFPAAGCFLAAMFFETLKYYIMLRKTAENASFKLAFEVAVLGKYYDNITPFGAGGQPFQIYHLGKNGVATGPAAALPIVGFLSLQTAFVVLALGTIFFGGAVTESIAIKVMSYAGILFYLFVPVVILLFSVFPKPANAILSFFVRLLSKLRIIKNEEKAKNIALARVADYHSCISYVFSKKGLLTASFLLSLAYHVAICSIPFFVILAFGGTTSWLYATVTTIFIYAAIACIPTPGNSGAAEVSFYSVFSMLTAGYMFWAMLVWRFLCYYTFIAMGLLLQLYRLWRGRRKKEELNNEQTEISKQC